MDDNIIYLTDENGEEIPFELLDTIEDGAAEYAVLMTIDPELSDNESDIVILKMEHVENSCEIMLNSIEDEVLEDRIFNLFVQKHPGEFDFTDM